MSFSFVDYCHNPATSFWDRTGDRVVTISDVWKLSGDVLRIPGDAVIESLLKSGGEGPIFLEMACSGMGGGWSTAISLFAWLSLFWTARILIEEASAGGVTKW